MADTRKLRTRRAYQRRRSIAALLSGMVAGAVIIGSSTGCSTLSGLNASLQNCECVDDFMISYRNSALAAKAWYEHRHCYANQKYLKDFEAGFRAGYEDVAGGSNGCTPSIAPREYWGWRYQSPEGQAKVAAWFAGYPMGAKAAEEDGLGNWSEIPTMFRDPEPIPPYLGDDLQGMPPSPFPPTGVPVLTSPMMDGMAPTPAMPAKPIAPKAEIDPFSNDGPLPGATSEGTSAQRPNASLMMPR